MSCALDITRLEALWTLQLTSVKAYRIATGNVLLSLDYGKPEPEHDWKLTESRLWQTGTRPEDLEL